MKRKVFFLGRLIFRSLAIVAVFSGITFAQPAVINELQVRLNEEIKANPSLPGELLHIILPKKKIDISLAAGLFVRTSKLPLDPHHVFRVASVTKTFTAVSILLLVESGKIKLDSPVSLYLSKEYLEMLEKDGYSTSRITVRHLLTHTSGIHDYATDLRYFGAIQVDPGHRWTRTEQVRFAMQWGKPRFEPGNGYHYSDTGYILLGEMVERLSNMPLPSAFRRLINFKKIGLDETYLETLEPAPAGVKALSHPYFGLIDALAIDASHDLYGGGGIVSSGEDLARFYRALLTNKIFKKKSTLATMLTVPPTNERVPGGAHAMGIFRRDIEGNLCWGHNGFWGPSAYHCPGIDLTIVRHYNQAEPDPSFIFNDLYARIFKILFKTK